MKSAGDLLKILPSLFERIIWTVGSYAFLFILIFVLMDFIFGIFLFYKYVYVAEKTRLNADDIIIRFDDKSYNNVLIKLQKNSEEPPESE